MKDRLAGRVGLWQLEFKCWVLVEKVEETGSGLTGSVLVTRREELDRQWVNLGMSISEVEIHRESG